MVFGTATVFAWRTIAESYVVFDKACLNTGWRLRILFVESVPRSLRTDEHGTLCVPWLLTSQGRCHRYGGQSFTTTKTTHHSQNDWLIDSLVDTHSGTDTANKTRIQTKQRPYILLITSHYYWSPSPSLHGHCWQHHEILCLFGRLRWKIDCQFQLGHTHSTSVRHIALQLLRDNRNVYWCLKLETGILIMLCYCYALQIWFSRSDWSRLLWNCSYLQA